MFSDIARQFSKELEPLRLPLEQIPLSKWPLQLSQWIHYIHLSNNLMLNIKLTSLIQKNVDTLSAPNPPDIQPWLDALKPEGKIERDVLKTEKDALKSERDVLKTQRDVLKTQRDVFQVEMDSLLMENVGLKRMLIH
ncbi:hypothetical protein TNCT_732021 [Trichonephila clavata]|uniref:Uncharacterized protein n=1 Tax=Trichonephila clavata TaxID=2740835 RepID=A0A8X6LLL0_TRICU|nr:hypothetical protein TNCT_732021 [Trichonephila clavata]